MRLDYDSWPRHADTLKKKKKNLPMWHSVTGSWMGNSVPEAQFMTYYLLSPLSRVHVSLIYSPVFENNNQRLFILYAGIDYLI